MSLDASTADAGCSRDRTSPFLEPPRISFQHVQKSKVACEMRSLPTPINLEDPKSVPQLESGDEDQHFQTSRPMGELAEARPECMHASFEIWIGHLFDVHALWKYSAGMTIKARWQYSPRLDICHSSHCSFQCLRR